MNHCRAHVSLGSSLYFILCKSLQQNMRYASENAMETTLPSIPICNDTQRVSLRCGSRVKDESLLFAVLHFALC